MPSYTPVLDSAKTIWSRSTDSAQFFGRVPYALGLRLQQETIIELKRSYRPYALIGLEHEPVITLGKRSEQEILVPETQVHHNGFEIHHSDRGGHATLHSPGQLVIYPICDLQKLNLGVRNYVRKLESVTQETLRSLDISTYPGAEPGLYTDKGKIAFFGIRVQRHITSHGISININNDLSAFNLIRSCGVRRSVLDRVGSYCQTTPEDVFLRFSNQFTAHFS